MKVIVAGSRTITDERLIFQLIRELPWRITEIVSGGARGVDTIASSFASLNSVPFKLFKADWDKYGRSAGMIRNNEMANYADCAFVAIANNSSGSQHMIDCMRKLGKPVIVFDYYQDGDIK